MNTYQDFKLLLESQNFQKRLNKLADKYRNKQIIIYGAGILTSVIFDNYNLSDLNIVAIADIRFTSNGNKKVFNFYNAISPYDIPDYKPDIILLSTYYQEKIIEFLETSVFTETKRIPLISIFNRDFAGNFLESKLGHFILPILQKFPVSSKIIGPPKGYITTKEWFADAGQGECIDILTTPTLHIKEENDNTESILFVAKIKNARVYGEKTAIITPDDRVLIDVSRDWQSKIEEYTVFNKFKLPPVKKVQGKLAVLSTEATDNYFHWFWEVLPRLELLRLCNVKPDKYIVRNSKRFQKESLEILGISDQQIMFNGNDFHIESEELIIPSLPIRKGPWFYDFIRGSFLPHKADLKEKPERIYISREDAPVRKINNEDELVECLEKYGFKKVNLSSLSLLEQVSLFSTARFVVAAHGAGLTNLAFSNPGVKLLEIFPYNFDVCFYASITRQISGEYYRIEGEQEKRSPGEPGVHASRKDITLNIEKVSAAIEIMDKGITSR